MNNSGAGCRLVGNRLEDLVLPDLNHQPFRLSDYHGSLILLYFWSTEHAGSIEPLTYIADIQRRYAAAGLIVVGIAREPKNRIGAAERARFISRRQGVNFKMLLSRGSTCPVAQQLGVRSLPTLILVAGSGEILWRTTDFNSQTLANLEAELRAQLQ